METAYSLSDHGRSLSSLASSILPVSLDISTHTSVTPSPMESQDPGGGSLALDQPLDLQKLLANSRLKERESMKQRGHAERNKVSMTQASVRSGEEGNNAKEEASNRFGSDFGLHGEPIPETSLLELFELMGNVSRQNRRARVARARKQQLAICGEIGNRLANTLRIAYGNLIDQFKTDDQAGFRGLYEASDQTAALCHRFRVSRALETGANEYRIDARSSSKTPIPWTFQLPAGDRQVIIKFFQRIRTDPTFLADRISSLSPEQLTALTSSYHPAGVDLSILTNHSHGATDLYSKESQMLKLSKRMDNLQCFHAQDPFFLLIYTCFDTTCKRGSLQYDQRNSVWSSVCARLITESKIGSDEFIVAAADAFMGFAEWELKPQLETYLLEVLNKGSFLLASPNQATLGKRSHSPDDSGGLALREAEFLDESLKGLFRLLANALDICFLPKAISNFIASTLQKVENPQLRHKTKIFFITRWYFASLLTSVLLYPELHGLALTHSITHAARRQILHKIVVHMQVQVFDILDSSADSIHVPESKDEIIAICQYFDFEDAKPPTTTQSKKSSAKADQTDDFMVLSSQDVASLIQTLYPGGHLTDSAAESTSTSPSIASSSTLRPDSSDLGSQASSMENHRGISPMTGDISMAPPANAESHIDSSSGTLPSAISAELDDNQISPAAVLWRVHRNLLTLMKDSNTSETGVMGKDWSILRLPCDARHNVGTAAAIDQIEKWPHGALGAESCHLSGPQRSYRELRTILFDLCLAVSNGQIVASDIGEGSAFTSSGDALEELLQTAMTHAQLALDYEAARRWWDAARLYAHMKKSPTDVNLRNELFHDIAKELRANAHFYEELASQDEVYVQISTHCDRALQQNLTQLESNRKSLRIKMWYMSDVRHSAAYEELLLVSQVLREMKASKRSRPSESSQWPRPRPRVQLHNSPALQQALEAMSAPSSLGDPSKLADEQIDMTKTWMSQCGVESFCRGEEKIHRFYYQIRKTVDVLVGPNLLESPVLWSSSLFRREKHAMDARAIRRPTHARGVTPSTERDDRQKADAASTSWSKSTFNPFNSMPIGSHEARDATYLHSNPPSKPISHSHQWSRPTSDVSSKDFGAHAILASGKDKPSSHPNGKETDSGSIFTDGLKQAVCALLISDVNSWHDHVQSGTDAWVDDAASTTSEPLDGPIDSLEPGRDRAVGPMQTRPDIVTASVHAMPGQSQNLLQPSHYVQADPLDKSPPRIDARNPFPFTNLYKLLLRRMSNSQDPFIKLQMICEIEALAVHDTGLHTNLSPFLSGGEGVSEDKVSSLDQIMANCTERRAGTLLFDRAEASHKSSTATGVRRFEDVMQNDKVVQKMLAIFRNSDLRPATLYRDLQMIAAFVPSTILDHSPRGKAFWDAGLAALALKEELCIKTVHRAASITNTHISSRTPPPPPFPSLTDAAQLWIVAAKEGSAVAARELGLFYLTHPDLIARTTMPFSRGHDIFRSTRRGSDQASTGLPEQKDSALDPLTFAVVYHWMEIAANGGDKEAKTFLRQGSPA